MLEHKIEGSNQLYDNLFYYCSLYGWVRQNVVGKFKIWAIEHGSDRSSVSPTENPIIAGIHYHSAASGRYSNSSIHQYQPPSGDFWLHHVQGGDIATLKHRSVPNEDFLQELDSAFGQAWFDGARSIIDQRCNDAKERLPLWILTYWKKSTHAIRAQAAWVRSGDWLARQQLHDSHDEERLSI